MTPPFTTTLVQRDDETELTLDLAGGYWQVEVDPRDRGIGQFLRHI